MPILTLQPGGSRETFHRWEGVPCTVGRAPGNDVVVQSEAISSYHAKVERRGDAYWLVDLNSTNGTFLQGVRVREALLQHGDEGRFGETIVFRFELLPHEQTEAQRQKAEIFDAEPIPPPTPPTPSPPPEPTPLPPSAQQIPVTPQMPPTPGPGMPPQPPPGQITAIAPIAHGAVMPQGIQCPVCQAFIPFSVNFCPRCGFSLAQTSLPAFPMAQGPMGGYVRPMEPPGGGVGMLPLVALLCGISIIGFPFAIILGLVSLAQIRRHGGFGSDRRQAFAGVLLGLFWAVVIAGLGTWYGIHRYRLGDAERQRIAKEEMLKDIAENEAAVVTDLKGIARTQKLAKVIRVKDPNQSGVGSYLTLDELSRIGTSFFNRELITGKAHGYEFTVREPTEAGYQAVAEPERYGETGKRTFMVDATGIVRAQDLDGKTFAQLGGPLAVMSETKTAFDEMDDAIAKEAIAYAKRLAADGKYDQCRLILDTIPEQFAMTTAAQELLALKKSVDPFIVEAQAQARYQKAQVAVAKGDLKLAIGLLKEIGDLYPSYTKIATVTEEMGRYQTELSQKYDKEAKALFEKAEAAERAGKPQDALDLYVQIAKNYPDTDWAKRVGDLQPAVQQSIREKGAEELFAQARNLSVTDNYRDVVNGLEQLLRNYSDTTYVRQNSPAITTLYQKALAQQYRVLAAEQMAAGRDADALARLEEACTKNPDLRPQFKDLFLKLYLRVGQKRMEEGDQREALALYRKYLALEPEKSEVSSTVVGQLNFAVAKSEFAAGNFPAAAANLVSARAAFNKDPEYNDLAGTVQIALGNYEDSLVFFDQAIAAKPDAGGYYARRGYAQIVRALYIEQEAMNAFAGLLGGQPVIAPAAPMPAPSDTSTNVPAPSEPESAEIPMPSAADFAPVFATALPANVAGTKPEQQIRYDAVASQTLLKEILDLMQAVNEIAAKTSITSSSGKGGSNATQNTKDAADRSRLDRIRMGVQLGDTVSAVHQKLLDHDTRKAKTADALRRMAFLFSSGNRDLFKAIQLSADRSAELLEICKATKQHETFVTQAATKIAAHLAIEIEAVDRAYQTTDTAFRNLRVQTFSAPSNPTAGLDIYFAKLFDRRGFDEGLQALRRSGAIRVPLEGYTVVPATATVPVEPVVPTPAPPAVTPMTPPAPAPQPAPQPVPRAAAATSQPSPGSRAPVVPAQP